MPRSISAASGLRATSGRSGQVGVEMTARPRDVPVHAKYGRGVVGCDGPDLVAGVEQRRAQVGIGKGVDPLLSHLKPSYQSLEAATGTALTPGYPVSAAVAVAQLVEPRV